MELPAPSVPLRRRNERGREEAGREGEEEEEEEEEEVEEFDQDRARMEVCLVLPICPSLLPSSLPPSFLIFLSPSLILLISPQTWPTLKSAGRGRCSLHQ
jgi:hypothetical protein